MKYETDVKELLISNAIHLIAESGFEKATTKELTLCGGHLPNCKMNEVYIYRFFGSKENLYALAFDFLDREMFSAFWRGTIFIGGFEGETNEELKEKLNDLFLMMWEFILSNEAHVRCYVRYFHSVYFKENALETHRQLFMGAVEKMLPMFKEGADAVLILNSVFTTLLNFGIRVYNGELEDNDDSRLHMFNILYGMMANYLKEQ